VRWLEINPLTKGGRGGTPNPCHPSRVDTEGGRGDPPPMKGVEATTFFIYFILFYFYFIFHFYKKQGRLHLLLCMFEQIEPYFHLFLEIEHVFSKYSRMKVEEIF
jgi:hypothetical protein